MKIGSLVYKLRPSAFTAYYGEPVGDCLRVIDITDHVPADGPRVDKAAIHLSDGTWEFPWNLIEVRKRDYADNDIERKQICLHEKTFHRGISPCTPPLICNDCGMVFNNTISVDIARHAAALYRNAYKRKESTTMYLVTIVQVHDDDETRVATFSDEGEARKAAAASCGPDRVVYISKLIAQSKMVIEDI